jgi:hypothetical protein
MSREHVLLYRNTRQLILNFFQNPKVRENSEGDIINAAQFQKCSNNIQLADPLILSGVNFYHTCRITIICLLVFCKTTMFFIVRLQCLFIL